MTDLLDLWPSMTVEERNRALRAVVASVVVRRAAYRGVRLRTGSRLSSTELVEFCRAEEPM
jgi:hypothetical protein